MVAAVFRARQARDRELHKSGIANAWLCARLSGVSGNDFPALEDLLSGEGDERAAERQAAIKSHKVRMWMMALDEKFGPDPDEATAA